MRVITGTARGIGLKTPEGWDVRPTAERVKEALFSAIQFDLPGARVLDLFAGTGQLGIEALSRGAKSAVFVDAAKTSCALVKENLKRTRLSEQATVVQSDYKSFLSTCRGQFDIILLDPPYAEVFLETALKCASEIDILAESGIIVTERPLGKSLDGEFPGFQRSKDYKYGKTVITIFRKVSNGGAE